MGTPQLDIKDAETTAMVRELADLTGESQTEAVRQAVKERLERHRRQDVATVEEIYSRLAKVSRNGAANKRTGASSDHGFLYDEQGAPV
jgi:antitoxin VapB